MELDQTKKIHVVGIGGIGVSALTRVLLAQHVQISGSDLENSEIIGDLRKLGAAISIGHKAGHLPSDTELVIYSNAIREDNPERAKARETGMRQMSYPEALGEFIKDKKVITVAGTNGKTTTTAMIGWIMEQAGLDPTVIVGSKVLAWNSNARVGKSDWAVIEADEYKRAFLNYHPDIAVITNIAEDHLDYFKDMQDIEHAFQEFIENIKSEGSLVYNWNDHRSVGATLGYKGKRTTFGIGYALTFGFPKLISFDSPNSNASKLAKQIKLKIPGWFYLINATAAIAVAETLQIPFETTKAALESFTGTWRRFEEVGKLGAAVVISDYAHHPAGIQAALDAAIQKFKDADRILAVFQPHQHNRTKKLFRQFVNVFCSACAVKNYIISEIFDVAGRENQQDQDISSLDLVKEIKQRGKNVSYAKDLADCEAQIRAVAKNYDAILVMGAGDLYKVADELVSSQ